MSCCCNYNSDRGPFGARNHRAHDDCPHDVPGSDIDAPILRVFQDLLFQLGFVRVLQSSADEVTICWNSYEIEVLHNRFFVVTFSNASQIDNGVNICERAISITTHLSVGSDFCNTCDGCRHFNANNDCLHVQLLEVLIISRREGTHDSLLKWVDDPAKLPLPLQKIEKLASGNRSIERYAVFLSPREADDLDVHMAAICTMTRHNNGKATILCASGRCSSKKFKSLNLMRNSPGACPHVAVLSKSLNAIQEDDEYEESNHHDSDEDLFEKELADEEASDASTTTDRAKVIVTEGLTFNDSSNSWVGSRDCSTAPIPRFTELTEVQRRMIRERLTLDCVLRDADNCPRRSPEGFLMGTPCVPKNCHRCNALFEATDRVTINAAGNRLNPPMMLLMSHAGTIQRPRFQCWCAACEVHSDWDPSSELVHTIRNGNYGGTYLDTASTFVRNSFHLLTRI